MSVEQSEDYGKSIWLMCGAMFMLPILDCFAKLLGENGMSPGQIVLFRFSFQVLILVPILVLRKEFNLNFAHFWLQLLRAFAMALATFCFFIAISHMPLADSIAIFFVEPMILTILSAIFLGETVRLRRVLAIIVGFIGAILIIRPQFNNVGVVAFLPLITATCFATYMLITRYFSQKISPIQMQFQMGLIIVPLVAIFSLIFPSTDEFIIILPNWFEIQLLVGLGFVATSGHLLLVLATKKAPANLLAPFQYVEIIGATLLGFFIFGDIPTRYTAIGIFLITLSGLYLWFRENQLQKKI